MTLHSICDPYLPMTAEVLECVEETRSIFTLHLRLVDRALQHRFIYDPGQFNMVYLYGVGEVAISIVSDPDEKDRISHTIRAVGRVTRAMRNLRVGDQMGIRGPYGHGWPLQQALGKDIVMITGGLGCAPAVSVINYIMARREQYGDIKILQGVKHSDDFIFRQQYDKWKQHPNTEVYIAADRADANWPWKIGYVTDMIQTLNIKPEKTIAMMCGPEMMMHVAVKALNDKGVAEDNIFLSMERNMECGIGHCGHCQYGGLFICKDGPIFAFPQIKSLFSVPGF